MTSFWRYNDVIDVVCARRLASLKKSYVCPMSPGGYCWNYYSDTISSLKTGLPLISLWDSELQMSCNNLTSIKAGLRNKGPSRVDILYCLIGLGWITLSLTRNQSMVLLLPQGRDCYFIVDILLYSKTHGALLLTWFNVNPSRDK